MSRHAFNLVFSLLLSSSIIFVSGQSEFASAPVLNVIDFGTTASGNGSSAGVEEAVNAPTDGVTDATPSVLAAIAALPASGGQLYFPTGVYLLTQALNINNVPVAIVGDGMSLSILRWSSTASSYGISVSQNSGNAVVSVHDISFYTDAAQTTKGTAFSICGWITLLKACCSHDLNRSVSPHLIVRASQHQMTMLGQVLSLHPALACILLILSWKHHVL